MLVTKLNYYVFCFNMFNMLFSHLSTWVGGGVCCHSAAVASDKDDDSYCHYYYYYYYYFYYYYYYYYKIKISWSVMT